VLGRIKASVDDPLALETAGYALYDLYAERRGNLFSDEVYRLTKAKDATTTYTRSIQDDFSADSISSTARYLPANHKFSRNDVILTLQPNGVGLLIPSHYPPDKAVDGRPCLEHGSLHGHCHAGRMFRIHVRTRPNDASTGETEDAPPRDRFFPMFPYRRMVDAWRKLPRFPTKQRLAKGEQRHCHSDRK
jgi:hypothetical protein